MTDKSDTIKKKLIQALEKSLGVVTTACKNVGVHRSTYYDYYNNDSKFKDEVDDILNVAIDFAESHLHEQIQGGNTSATIFYLKTKAKHRGYVERQEITGAEGMPTNFQIEIIGRTKDKD
jgi:hypothetical protein|tara:strand:+ start:2685 stop:3044 length:360 start_codon:yes stop_codon:yes gene_type:complete